MGTGDPALSVGEHVLAGSIQDTHALGKRVEQLEKIQENDGATFLLTGEF